jgi:tripartite-type tricarboxylate transporter receptor subunit TctC
MAIGKCGLLVILSALLTVSGRAAADPVADFYHGKIITLNIGFSAGGGFDVYARTVARFMSRHIPGRPQIVPQQMPGAGSFRAAQYMAAAAPQDGTELATIAQSVPLEQALHDPGVNFDARNFGWVGNPVNGVSAVLVWSATGIRTLDDAKKRQVTIGSDGNNVTSQYPMALNAVFGTKFQIVLGYPGGSDINLAMERGEVDGEGQSEWSSLQATEPGWLRDKKINLLVQIGLTKNPEMSAYMGSDVPLMTDLARTDEDRRLLELLSSGEVYGRPLLTTPGVPPERLAALRTAFDATMKDPDFLAEAKRIGLEVSPLPGMELQKVTDRIVTTPQPIVQKLSSIIRPSESP